jgi:Rod binding domain-containing protein
MSAIGQMPGLQHVSSLPDHSPRGGPVNSVTPAPVRAMRLEPIDRSKVDPQILQAADGMEAMFVDYMYKVMRQTVPKDELTADSPATEIYQGMLDSEVAQKAAKTKGLGLSDQIIAYLNSRSYTGAGGTGARMTPAGAAENYSKISREKDIGKDEAQTGVVQAE